MERINFENLPNTSTPINKNNLNKMQDNIETKFYRLDITTALAAGGQVTLPCYYKVGTDSLKVRLRSEVLIKASTSDTQGHYYEVGDTNSISNTIQITSDWSLDIGDILIIEVQGVYESENA